MPEASLNKNKEKIIIRNLKKDQKLKICFIDSNRNMDGAQTNTVWNQYENLRFRI